MGDEGLEHYKTDRRVFSYYSLSYATSSLFYRLDGTIPYRVSVLSWNFCYNFFIGMVDSICILEEKNPTDEFENNSKKNG